MTAPWESSATARVVNEPLPVEVTASGVTAISAGGYHSLMIAGGAVWAFGYGGLGQIGNGQLLNKSTAVQANLPNGVTPRAIAAGAISQHGHRLERQGLLVGEQRQR